MQQPQILLNNGVTMPQIGLGVWQARNGQEVEVAVSDALRAGYRSVDTAAAYGNEVGVGRAIARCDIPREELFVTTKLWNADQGYDRTLVAFERSLKRLGLSYIDLYLIHWPTPARNNYIETWRAFEQLYRDGKIRAIGVSNFTAEYLEALLTATEIVPAVNQIELHPQLPQLETRAFCQAHGIAVESYSPLGSSKGTLLHDPTVTEIGTNYHKSAAQILIRWQIQQGLIVIPKSVHADRIAANIDVFDFELNADDMARIATLTTGRRIGIDPSIANFAWKTSLVQIAHKFNLVRW